MNVTKPENSLIYDMFRTIRSEDRLTELMTLDVECNESSATHLAIKRVVRSLPEAPFKAPIQSEFVERGSIIHVNRVIPDEPINSAKKVISKVVSLWHAP